MLPFLSSLFITIATAIAPLPATVPASQPAGKQVRLPESLAGRAQVEADYAGLPQRNVNSIADVLRFERRGKQLIVTPKLENLQQVTRLMIDDLPGIVTMNYAGPTTLDDPDPPNFSYIERDFTADGAREREAIVTVSMASGHMTIARDSETEDALVSVQMLSEPAADPIADPSEPIVRLYISRHGQRNRDGDFEIKRTANSFRELQLQFGSDVNKYVRPILRGLKQDAIVFAPDPRLAWQVLGEGWQPDAAIVASVNSIVARLGVDDFQQRLAARAEIQQLGQPAAVVLMRLDRLKLPSETQSAIDSILEPYVQVSAAEAKSLRADPTFLLDALSTDDPILRQLAWKQLKELTRTTITFDPDAGAAARNAALAKLAEAIRSK